MKPSFDELRNLYEVERLSQYQIAARFGVNQATVHHWLKSYGINCLPRNTLATAKPPVRPDIETVRRLYEIERLSTRQIGKQLGVSKTEVLRWLKFYDIPPRPDSIGLLYRGVTEPTRDELVDMIQVQHLGYREIAKLYGVNFSAIPYWLEKHNIEKPTVWDTRHKGRRTMPTKEELTELYAQGHSLTHIAEQYGVSENPIRNLCRKYNIEVRPDGFDGGKRYTCNDDHLVRSLYEQQVDNWLFEHGIEHIVEPILPFDHRCKSDFLANGWYIEIWGVSNSKEYTERRKRKTKLYQDHNLPLIELEIHHFQARHNHLWARRLVKKLFTAQIL